MTCEFAVTFCGATMRVVIEYEFDDKEKTLRRVYGSVKDDLCDVLFHASGDTVQDTMTQLLTQAKTQQDYVAFIVQRLSVWETTEA